MAIAGSWLMKNRARNLNHDSEWSFSCRMTPYDACSGSDSDVEHEKDSSKISEEARLLNELDLSAREETVQYKPNPFSIAKINAASRGLSIKETISQKPPSRTQRPSSRPPVAIISRNKNKKGNKNHQPHESIIDKLKKQPEKAVIDSHLKKAVPLTSICSPVPLDASISISNSISKPSDPLPTSDVDVEVSRAFHAVETNDIALPDIQGASDISFAAHIPTSGGSTCTMPLSSLPNSSQTTHITSPSAQISLSVPPHEDSSSSFSDLFEDELPAANEDTSTKTFVDIEHDTLSVALPQNSDSDIMLNDTDTSASTAPALAQYFHYPESPSFPGQQDCDLDPSLSFDSPRNLTMKSTINSNPTSTISTKPCIRLRPLSLSSPPKHQDIRTPVSSSFTASSHYRAAIMSSPLRPANHFVSRDMSRMPIFPSHVANCASLAAPFLFKPRGNFARKHTSSITRGREPSTIQALVHCTDHDYSEESATSLLNTHEVEDIPNSPHFSSPYRADRSLPRFSTPLRKITPGIIMKTSQLGRAFPSGYGTGDLIDDSECDVKSGIAIPHPEDIDYHAYKGSTTPKESACVLPPDSIVNYPDTDHKRPRSPRPGLGTTKRRFRAVKDAYDFLSSDPDENWGTLPVKKKLKTRTPSPVMRTKKFRLPKLGLGTSKTAASLKIERTGMEANSARRVITFLPPPLPKPASTHLESERKVISSQAAYPSPSYSVLNSSSSPVHEMPVCSQSQHPSPAEGTDTKAYKPLSPPPSDSPCVTPDQSTYHTPMEVIEDRGGLSDVHNTPISLPSIARLYPGMKANWRQRRKRIEEVWNLLELPSCGSVYCDRMSDIGLDEGEFQEIGIVVFRGVHRN